MLHYPSGIIEQKFKEVVPAMLVTSGNMVNPDRRIGMFILTRKKCSRCGKKKFPNEFPKYKRNKDGLLSWCFVCERERIHKYRANNADKNHEYYRKYRDANRGKVQGYSRKHYAANADKERERRRKWASENSEKKSEINRKWRVSHLDKLSEYQRERRACKLSNGGKITAQEWQSLKKYYDYTCLCCMRREPEIKLTLDHVLPLKLGGKNIIQNAQLLCESCNSRKGARHIDYRKGKVYYGD